MTSKDISWIPATLLQPGVKWRRKFIWDADDCTFTFRETLAEYVRKQRGLDLDLKTCPYYDFSLDPNLPYSTAEFQQDFIAFSRLTKGGYDTRIPRPGVEKAMKLLEDNGIVNCLWTAAPGTNDHIPWLGRTLWSAAPQEATFELIEKYKLPIQARNVKFLGAGQKASEMAEGHYPAIADDNLVTQVDVGSRGLLAFLINQPYNQAGEIPNVIRVGTKAKNPDLLQVAKMVVTLFNELERRNLMAE